MGSVVTRTYWPLINKCNAQCITVYSADKGKPLSVKDESVTAECVATVKIPPFGITGRSVQVSFAFGEAELRVTYVCEATGVHLLRLSCLFPCVLTNAAGDAHTCDIAYSKSFLPPSIHPSIRCP